MFPPSGGLASLARMNLSCGPRIVPDWLNVDLQEGEGIDVACDIRHGLPLPDGSFKPSSPYMSCETFPITTSYLR